jgi:orotate phosphoribosyltransferase
LLELLRTHAHERRQVTLSSGRVSDFYIDCKQVVLSAEGHFLVGWLFLRTLEQRAPAVEAVGGLTMGADPLVSATTLMSYFAASPLAGFYVRKEPKKHGTAEWIEGRKGLRAGMPVAILEDVVTTGASTMTAISRAREASLDVRCALALVDREEGGREEIERACPLHALFTKADFS